MGYKNFENRKEYQKFYRENNKEKINKYANEWYAKNKESIKAKLLEYNLKYPGKIAQRRREWADKNVEKRLLKSAKGRSKREGIYINLQPEDIKVPIKCPILDIKLKTNNRDRPKYNSPSLDRINNNRGYTKTNVQVVSYQANTMKGDATPKELLKFAYWVILTYGHLIDKDS
jgi:hypothetical protein